KSWSDDRCGKSREFGRCIGKEFASYEESQKNGKPQNERKDVNPNKNKSVFVTTAGFGSVAVTTRWILTLCSALLLAGPVGAVERPFQGRIDGQFVATPTLNPTVYVGGAQAVGNGTHVGAFTKVTSDVTD